MLLTDLRSRQHEAKIAATRLRRERALAEHLLALRIPTFDDVTRSGFLVREARRPSRGTQTDFWVS